MICKVCGEDKELNIKNFHRHPHNKNGFFGSCRKCRSLQRNNRVSKYTYFYEIEKEDLVKKGQVKANDKNSAIRVIKIKFFGWKIKKLCTFKYKNNTNVRFKKGTRRD